MPPEHASHRPTKKSTTTGSMLADARASAPSQSSSIIIDAIESAPAGRRRLHVFTAIALAFLGIIALCAPFALTGAPVPDWLVIVGRWVPAVASLAAILLVPIGIRDVRVWWMLRPGGWRGFATAYATAVAVMAVVLALPVVLVALLGVDDIAAPELLLTAVPLLLVGGLLFGLSTLGEEVLWRAHLQQLLSGLGFWRASLAIGAVWMLWHVPLHLTYWLQGSMPLPLLLVSTLSLLAWAPLLAALVAWHGSVWPAVVAHAVPISSVQLLQHGADQTTVVVVAGAINALAMLATAAWLRRLAARAR